MQAVFLFEAESWSTVVTSTIVLTEVFRQKEVSAADKPSEHVI